MQAKTAASIVKIKSIGHVTHDVLCIITEKPQGYIYTPGQATEISINKIGWQEKKRPFTFTCLPHYPYLEFTTKTYPSRNGVTNQLLRLKQNDELILHEVFGAIHYKGEGVFIAGGAGVTPFVAIFRDLKYENKLGKNKLIFANKTKADIIYKDEFSKMLGGNFINILSDEKTKEYSFGQITENFLKENIGDTNQYFYICGPDPMIKSIEAQLLHLKVNPKYIVKEKF